MPTTRIGSGVLSPTLLVAAGLVLSLTVFRRVSVPGWARNVALAGLAAGAAGSLALGVYRSYVVPRDILQDIVAAREYLAGRPMHPEGMNGLMRVALDEERPRVSLLGWWPAAAQCEREQYEETLREHWVQAHPPPMTLAVAPLVEAFGVLGTQAAVLLLSVVGLGVTLWLLLQELWPTPGCIGPAFVVFAVAGWDPVVEAFRTQQPAPILLALLTVAWVCVRRGRPALAGPAAAAAAALKLVPGLLAVPLVIRHRRAGVTLVLTGLLLVFVVLALVPSSDLRGYRETAAGVVDEYAGYPAMISLLGVYARAARQLGLPLAPAEGVWLVTLFAVLGAWTVLLVRKAPPGADPRREVDYEFAVGMSLIPWLSPIAWCHYLVFLLLPLAVLGSAVFRGPPSRPRRVGYALLLVALALPDGIFLTAFEQSRRLGWEPLSVWVLQPFRAVVGILLTGWLVREWVRTVARVPSQPRADALAVPAGVAVPA